MRLRAFMAKNYRVSSDPAQPLTRRDRRDPLAIGLPTARWTISGPQR
jgi:hypothetical protein